MLMRMRTGTLICSRQKCKMVQPFWKIVRQLCEKLDIKPTQTSNSTLRCFTQEIWKHVHKKICTRMFTVMCACQVASVQSLSDPMDCSPPGSFVYGILQARILEWVAIPFSGGSSRPRDQTQVSHIAGRFFTIWAIPEAKPGVKLWSNAHFCK